MPRFFLVSAMIFALGISMLGCGGNQQLSGKITFSDNNEPLSVGIICFQSPDGSMSRGEIQQDGTYVVDTQSHRDGLPLGTYGVFITSAVLVQYDKDGNEASTFQIDAKYSDAKTSGLAFTADGKTRTFDFSVDRPSK